MASSWKKAEHRWIFLEGLEKPAEYRLPLAAAGAWALGGCDVGSACTGGAAVSGPLSFSSELFRNFPKDSHYVMCRSATSGLAVTSAIVLEVTHIRHGKLSQTLAKGPSLTLSIPLLSLNPH